MVATTLRARPLALVQFDAEDGDDPRIAGIQATHRDIVSSFLLAPIGSGTVIYLTDRTWTSTAGNNNLNSSPTVHAPMGRIMSSTERAVENGFCPMARRPSRDHERQHHVRLFEDSPRASGPSLGT